MIISLIDLVGKLGLTTIEKGMTLYSNLFPINLYTLKAVKLYDKKSYRSSDSLAWSSTLCLSRLPNKPRTGACLSLQCVSAFSRMTSGMAVSSLTVNSY